MSRDRDVYQAIEDLIDAIPEVAAAGYGLPIQDLQEGADRTPVVTIEPIGWTEDDNYDPVAILRSCTGHITIAARHEESPNRLTQLDQVANAIANAIGGYSLADLTLPALTRIRSGNYQAPQHPEQRLTLLLEFAYFTDTYGGRDTTD